MYTKRLDGPCVVVLADGSVLTIADLPPANTSRWVASRKAIVVHAVTHGLLSLSEALKRYDLSEEEFNLWQSAVVKHGEKGLKVTMIQKCKQL